MKAEKGSFSQNTPVFFEGKNKFYDEYAKIQSDIAKYLAKLARIAAVLPTGLWLDLGCGTGFAEKNIQNKSASANFISLDIAFSSKIDVCADFDYMPFCKESFDNIISTSAIQWSKNIESLMENIAQILKKDGKFIVSVFETGTLANLMQTQIDFQIIPQVSFFERNDFERIIRNAGFEVSASKSKTFTQIFPNGYSALKSISKIGATSHSGKFLSKNDIKRFISQYEKSFEDAAEITHDYKTLFYILSKSI